MRDALELTETGRGEGEAIFDIAGSSALARVVRQLVRLVGAQLQVVAREPEPLSPLHPLLAPECVPLARLLGMAEELDLHLLELATAEREVAWRDLVAEGLADLRDAERHLDPGRVDDILELH